jgi:hypothetical protein
VTTSVRSVRDVACGKFTLSLVSDAHARPETRFSCTADP